MILLFPSVCCSCTHTNTHTSLCPSVRCCLKDQYFLYIIFLFENEKYVFTGTKSQNICGCILIRWQFEINDFVVICWPQCFHGDLIWFLVMAVSCDGHFHLVSFGILGQQAKNLVRSELIIYYCICGATLDHRAEDHRFNSLKGPKVHSSLLGKVMLTYPRWLMPHIFLFA